MDKSIIDDRARHQAPRRGDGGPKIFQRRQAPPITERQKHILTIIREYIDLHGEPPTLTVLGRWLKVTPAGALSNVRALAKKGYITMYCDDMHTIELTGKVPPS